MPRPKKQAATTVHDDAAENDEMVQAKGENPEKGADQRRDPHKVVSSFTYTEDPRSPSTLPQVLREHWVELMPDYPSYIRMGKSAFAAYFYGTLHVVGTRYHGAGRTVPVEYNEDMDDDLVEFVRT